MNQYIVKGCCRVYRAIGMPRNFEETVRAKTARGAYKAARRRLYKAGMEHVQVKEIALILPDKLFPVIPPDEWV